MMEFAPYLSRSDIMKFPFPYKLWICIHFEGCSCLRWNRDGTFILLDLIALETYLQSIHSIFKIKNRSTFLYHLESFCFQRLNAKPEAEEDLVLLYKNENFQRHRLDLLGKLRRRNYFVLESAIEKYNKKPIINDNSTVNQEIRKRVAERMMGDLCFMAHGALSDIQKSRMFFQTVLNFQHETGILKKKLKMSAPRSHHRRYKNVGRQATTTNGNTTTTTPAITASNYYSRDDQLIEIPMDLFENPHDSVLHFDNFSLDYAGYYGNCHQDLILNFFGDYLPKYEHGAIEVKKTADDLSSKGTGIGRSASMLNTPPSTANDGSSECAASIPCTGISSSLEPIFKPDDEQLQTINYKVNGEDMPEFDNEIAMEELMKYHNTLYTEEKPPLQIPPDPIDILTNRAMFDSSNYELPKEFNQMPSDVKIEEEPGKANFRNFFSTYRSSLNLLYDRGE